VAGVGAVGLGAALCTAPSGGLGRLGEVRGGAFSSSAWQTNSQPVQASTRDVNLASGQAVDPFLDSFGVRRCSIAPGLAAAG
jgi:hypothetical protein